MNAVAYCRVSTDTGDQLNSLETQRDFFEAYARKMGYHLIHVYSDKGLSGARTQKRDGFRQMMEEARLGRFQTVLVKDISRLARNTVDLLKCCRELREYGIEVQFLSYQMNNMGSSEFLLTMYAALAQEESHNTSQRIKFSKRHNASKGKVPNLIYGYDKIAEELFQLRINPTESEIVKQIFRWYVKDGDGTMKIAQKLNGMGVRTKRGYRWTQNAVARILSHDIYVGKIIGGKEEIVNFPDSRRIKKQESDWITVQNDSLRIIDDEVFFHAQALLRERADAFGKTRHSNKHLFSTLIRCKECGWSFRRTVKTYKNTYVRWVCSARNGHGTDACGNAIAVDENDLILALQNYFAKLLQNEEQTIESTLRGFEEARDQKHDDARRNELIGRIKDMRARKEREMLLFSNGFLTMDELNRRIGYIKTELPQLEAELARLRAQNPDRRQKLPRASEELYGNVSDVRNLSNAELKRIVKEITVDKDGHVDVYLNLLEPNT